MHARHSLLIAAALLLSLAACGRQPAPATPTTGGQEPTGFLGSQMQETMDKAKAELETKNLTLNGGSFSVLGSSGKNGDTRLPKAEITPQGELLIENARVTTTPEQQALLKQYRSELIGIASAGMDIGVRGADLGMKAATEALKGAFRGEDQKDIEKRVEAQTGQIKAAAKQLCERIPALLDAQQRLAAALPEFKPYATMDQTDIDDCEKDIDDETAGMSDADRAKLQQDIRDEIRNGVRNGVREAVQAVAGETETATAAP